MKRLITLSCVLTIVALALIVVGLIFPTPMTVIVALSAGQAIGTLAFALFLWAVINDLRGARARDDPEEPPS